MSLTKLRFARTALTWASLLVWTASAPASSAAELPSLVGHWKLDEGAGATAVDSSGFGRHGTIAGGSYVTNGLARTAPNPYALQLNGAGGHIAIPDSPDWHLTPSNSLTISLWVTLLEDRGAFHVFGKRQGCGGGDWFYQLARDDRGLFFMTQGGAVFAARRLVPGLLTHVAVTYDAGEVRLYLDGLLAGSGVAPMATTPAGPLLFGTSGSCGESETFPGIVDDIRVYRGALSGEQIGPVVETAMPVARLEISNYMPVAIDEAKNLIYISTPYRGESPETLLVIEGNTHTAIDRLTFTKDGEVTPAMGIALDLQRNRLYVTTGDTRLWVLDATTRNVTEIIELLPGVGAARIAVNPTTGVAYLPIGERLLIVDPFKPAGAPGRVSVIPSTLGYYCVGVAVNPVHNLIYIGGQQDESVCPLVVIDADPSSPTYHTVLRVLPATEDRHLKAFAVDRRNGKVYVVAWNWPGTYLMRVLVVEGDPGRPSFHTVTNEIAVDLRSAGHATYDWIPVFGLAVNSNSNRLYIQTNDPRGDRGGWSLATFDAATTQLASIRRLPFQLFQGYGNDPALNAATNRLYVGDGNNEILVLEDSAANTISTAPAAPGHPVLVSSNHVSLTFTEVIAAGVTQVQPVAASSLNLTVPGAYSIDGALAYEVTTTASVVAPITLCFNAWHVDDAGAFAALRVLHGENGALVDRTSSHDFATRTVCATVGSLSPFVIARYTEPTYGIVRLDDGAKSHKAGSTVPVRLQIASSAGVNLSSASLAVHAIDLRLTSTSASFPVVDSGQPNPGRDFRFEAGLGGSGGYIFNLKTTGLSAGAYELRFTVGTGRRQYSVAVQVR